MKIHKQFEVKNWKLIQSLEFDGVESEEESNGWVWREKEVIRDEIKSKSITGNISVKIEKCRALGYENFEKWCIEKIVQTMPSSNRVRDIITILLYDVNQLTVKGMFVIQKSKFLFKWYFLKIQGRFLIIPLLI